MANWCATKITFFSQSKEQVEELEKVLVDLDSKPSRVENDFGNLWLGNVLDVFGFDWNKFSCRGVINAIDSVSSLQLSSGEIIHFFEIETEEAWERHPEIWESIFSQECFDEVNFVYIAEESGNGLYINTDSKGIFYSDRYYVDVCLENENRGYESAYFENDEGLFTYLKELAREIGLPDDFQSIEQAQEMFSMRLNDEEFISVHRYESQS